MSDPRFARLKSDPRFRRPRKKEAKVVIDDRFKAVFAQEKSKKKSQGRVDKYGRQIADTHEKDNLKRFYRLEDEEDEPQPKAFHDYARGDVLLESSDEECEPSSDKEDERVGRDSSRPIPIPDDPLVEIDLDETEFADLDAQAAAYSKENPDDDEPEGVRTHRLAVVNLDWDHVRAIHLYKICSSLVSPTAPVVTSSSRASNEKREVSRVVPSNMARGRVLGVRVYPSEFGKERMVREETEGPPPEIFKSKRHDDEEINAQNIYDIGDEDDYDKDALRNYQLERLRYYYAIITCDTVDAATHIYRELQGTELERSANVFDMSYVPNGMSFDDDFRDEATDVSNAAYKNVDFVTDALRHSKVKLTWDEDDHERNHITRRTLSKKEIDDADFRAYLASSSSESESEVQLAPKSKSKDKKATRDTLRALLLGGGDDLPEGWGREDDNPGDVDMEITFTPGLTNTVETEETTLDKYQRKVREKRKKRKEEVKGKSHKAEISESEDAGVVEDDFFDIGSDEEVGKQGAGKVNEKKSKRKAKAISPEPPIRPESTTEELALLVASNNPAAQPNHFNLKSVLKAEKKARRKGKKGKHGKEEDNEVQADFAIDVNDERFKVLHENHQYAIDPTNPQYKKTSSMDAFLKERSRRQKEHPGDNPDHSLEKPTGGKDRSSLTSLVESVKRKSGNTHGPGTGKRRKL